MSGRLSGPPSSGRGGRNPRRSKYARDGPPRRRRARRSRGRHLRCRRSAAGRRCRARRSARRHAVRNTSARATHSRCRAGSHWARPTSPPPGRRAGAAACTPRRWSPGRGGDPPRAAAAIRFQAFISNARLAAATNGGATARQQSASAVGGKSAEGVRVEHARRLQIAGSPLPTRVDPLSMNRTRAHGLQDHELSWSAGARAGRPTSGRRRGRPAVYSSFKASSTASSKARARPSAHTASASSPSSARAAPM